MKAVIAAGAVSPAFTFFIEYFNEKDELETLSSSAFSNDGDNQIKWRIPDVGGHAIYRHRDNVAGSGACGSRLDGSVIIKSLDWSGGAGVLPHGKIHGNDADPDSVDDDHIMAEDICLICGSFLPGLYNDIFHLPCGAQRCCDDGYYGLG